MLRNICLIVALGAGVAGCQSVGTVAIAPEPQSMSKVGFVPVPWPPTVRVAPNTVVTGYYKCPAEACGAIVLASIGRTTPPQRANPLTSEEQIKSGFLKEDGLRAFVQNGASAAVRRYPGASIDITNLSIDRKNAIVGISGHSQSTLAQSYWRMQIRFVGNTGYYIGASASDPAVAARYARLEWAQ